MSGYIATFKDKGNFGAKGNNLRKIYDLFNDSSYIKIPDTLILKPSLFKKIMLENGNTDFSDYQNIIINPSLINEILTYIHKKFDNDNLVVRSSATCEDSIFFSGAGQYDSFLNIKEDEDIINAIKKVYSSFYNKNAILYSKIYNIDLKKESMAILIQKVVPVKTSGVMFSCNPIDGGEKYIIESSKGLGTAVVEGTGTINNLEIEYGQEKNITDTIITSLIEIMNKLKQCFGFDVDVEWGIDEEKNIYIFQTRPIILNEFESTINHDYNIEKIKGEVISKGFNIGKINNISNKENSVILYQDIKYDFNNLELLLGRKGVILKDKSKLSHFANILRELNKPCLTMEKFDFKQNNLYIIDSYNGLIIDFEKLNPNLKVKYLILYFSYLKQVYKNSFEKFNGIKEIDFDNKIEQVAFGIDEKKVINKLKQSGYKKRIISQSIYTYDLKDRSLIDGKGILRIQVSNGIIKIQLKQLSNNNDKNYREEHGILICFESLEKAKKFMYSLNMEETGYQERKIINYVKGKIAVNIIKWPGCDAYLGIEAENEEMLKIIVKELEIDNCELSGMGGKEIFSKLNLTLNKCKFEE